MTLLLAWFAAGLAVGSLFGALCQWRTVRPVPAFARIVVTAPEISRLGGEPNHYFDIALVAGARATASERISLS